MVHQIFFDSFFSSSLVSKILLALLLFSSQPAVALNQWPLGGKLITDGTILEGSRLAGGLQPDYLIDLEHPSVRSYLEQIKLVSAEITDELKKVEKIALIIRQSALPRRDYADPEYRKLMTKFSEREIPIGEYLTIGAGTCREYSILMHIGLASVGIESRYLYLKIETNGLVEDHAINLIRHQGKLVIVDAYETLLHGLDYDDFVQGKATHLGRPQFIKVNNFPALYSPSKSLKNLPKLPALRPGKSSANLVGIKFGPEFTFSNEEMRNADWSMENGDVLSGRPENIKALYEYKNSINELCKQHGCRVIDQIKILSDGWHSPEVKVEFPDGWWFVAGLDPGVIEFQTMEMSETDMKRLASRIKSFIFDVAEQIGLRPSPGVGGGHIHLDLKTAFGDDAILFRNFVVDFANYSGLADGPLSLNKGSATPIAALRSDQKLAFRKVILDFDEGRIPATITDLAQAIEKRVYFRSPFWADPPQKYMALNFSRITKPNLVDSMRTLEIRSIRAQGTFDDFQKLTKLFQSRISRLRNLRSRVSIGPLKMPNTHAERMDLFRSYVTGAGLAEENYLRLLPRYITDCEKRLLKAY